MMDRSFVSILLLINYSYANVSTENVNRSNNETDHHVERNKFLENLFKIVRNNYENRIGNDIDHIPSDALNGVYVECILGLSFPCLQKKMIRFLYKLDKMKNINLIGKSVAIVRKKDNLSDTTVLAKIADYIDQAYLKDIIDNLIDKFFENHLLRLKVSEYFDGTGDENEGTYIDIDFGIEQSPAKREGRSKRPHHGGGGGGKIKGLKKMMMLLGLMTCMKLSMLGPMMLGLIGLKAMKALILAVMSLTISKMMMLGKTNLNGLLAGYGGSGGHGGGWDRTIQEQYSSTSSLPYHMEPPLPYNSYTVH